MIQIIRRRFQEVRSMLALTQSHKFPDIQTPELAMILRSGTLKDLRLWVKRNTIMSFDDVPMRLVRKLAAENHVTNYSRKKKEELVDELLAKRVRPCEAFGALPESSRGAGTPVQDAGDRKDS